MDRAEHGSDTENKENQTSAFRQYLDEIVARLLWALRREKRLVGAEGIVNDKYRLSIFQDFETGSRLFHLLLRCRPLILVGT